MPFCALDKKYKDGCFLDGWCHAIRVIALMIEAVSTFETSVNFYDSSPW
jgi:hypothetical protein